MLEPRQSVGAVPAPEPVVAPPPWWRFGMVWFILSGPAIVVVAGFVTLAICIKYPDVELHEAPPVTVVRTPAANPVPSGTWQPGEAATVSGH
jgi:hypothetical protein